MTWSLPTLLQGLHTGIHQRLTTARRVAGHPVAKGDAAEAAWLDMLRSYLPQRYQATRAFVVDSNGAFSQQIDIVIFDRQYSPFVFHQDGLDVVPAESVYAVFEAKQVITADEITYAQGKAASVRALHRTSLPIPHAGGVAEPKVPHHIMAGLVTLESGWKPPLGDTLIKNLLTRQKEHTLDLGCVAAHGIFARQDDDSYLIEENGMAATAFLGSDAGGGRIVR